MKFIVKYCGEWSQMTPWMVGIRWPDGQTTLLWGRYMGTWQDAVDDALKLVEENKC